MSNHREGIFVEGLWVEKGFANSTLSQPANSTLTQPAIDEVGATSAPLLSAAFHLEAYCSPYNQDFMLCKAENSDPKACLKEGRKVTRCSIDLLEKLRQNCEKQWNAHWMCLDKNNQMMEKCRSHERQFNECVFTKLGLEKKIPETPEGKVPIHLKSNPQYK